MKHWQAIWFLLSLGACSSGPKSTPPPPPPAPPDITKALPAIKNVVGQMNLTGPLQFAGPIAATTKNDPPYFICLKSTAENRFTIVLFFKGDKFDSARLATTDDHCDSQAYQQLPS